MDDLVMIVAYVRRARRAAVTAALRSVGVDGWNESEILGYGQAAAGRGVEHARFELVVTRDQVGACEVAIAEAAHTGAAGDGLVVVLPVSSRTRIVEIARPPG